MRTSTIAGLLIAVLCAPLILCAQFEGTMTIKETTTANGRTTEGRRMTLYFSKDNFRWDQYIMGHISAGSQIFSREGNSAIMFMAEKKRFCKIASQEWIDKKHYTGYNPFSKASADMSETGKKKTIAGIECTEWKVAYRGRPETEQVMYTVWTTDKLGLQEMIGFGPEIFDTDMVGIVWLKLYDKGLMPLGWAVEKFKDQVSTIEAVSVEKKKVDPAMFKVPKGYTEVKGTSELMK